MLTCCIQYTLDQHKIVWWNRSTFPFVRGRYGSVVMWRMPRWASSSRNERFFT